MNGYNILWCGKYSQDWENKLHEHTFFQLVVVSEGEAIVQAGEETLEAGAGDVLLFRPQTFHGIRPREEKKGTLRLYDVKFDVNEAGLFQKLWELPVQKHLEDVQTAKYYFNRIMAESEKKLPFYMWTISCYLWMILLMILRTQTQERQALSALPEPESGAAAQRGNIDIAGVESYIQENYIHNITLDTLSQVARSNKTSLTQAFKETYGTTPLRYIIQLRLAKAKELLVETNISISEISELVGFQTIHYFSRFFKEKEHCSPLEYRMRNSGNRFYTF